MPFLLHMLAAEIDTEAISRDVRDLTAIGGETDTPQDSRDFAP
jgi:hypothetical protein